MIMNLLAVINPPSIYHTSRSSQEKSIANPIDIIGNSCIIAIANSDLTLIQFTTVSKISQQLNPSCYITPFVHIINFCFINIMFSNLLRLKGLLYEIVLKYQLYFVLIVDFTLFHKCPMNYSFVCFNLFNHGQNKI